MHVYLYATCVPDSCKQRTKVSDSLELELRTPKGYNMDAKRLNLSPLEEQMSPLSSPSGMILEPIAL